MGRARSTVLALGGVLLCASLAPAAAAPGLAVTRAEVRFAPGDGVAASLLLRGDLTAGPSLATFHPTVDPFRLVVGPLVLLEGPPWPGGSRYRATRTGWRLDLRGPFRGRGRATIRLSPSTGRFTVEARGFDGGALRNAGPADVSVEWRSGEETYAAAVDFTVAGPRRWIHVARIPVGPPPGGGAGGGGGGGPPPAPGGLATIAQGGQSLITSFRFEVVRDAPAWASLWQQHGGAGSPPAVDFSSEMVVGVWLGARPTGGYSAIIVQVSSSTAVIIEDQPGWTPVAQVVSYPFHIVRAPRVEGPITYELVTRSQ